MYIVNKDENIATYKFRRLSWFLYYKSYCTVNYFLEWHPVSCQHFDSRN